MVLFMAGEPAAGPRLSLAPQWNVPASGGIEVVEIPGNHYSILRFPHVEEPARALNVRLDRAAVPA
jgi:thioesterase domain-containing protein